MAEVSRRMSRLQAEPRSEALTGSVAKFSFGGWGPKVGIRIPMAYGCPQARKTNFATEPAGGHNWHYGGSVRKGVFCCQQQKPRSKCRRCAAKGTSRSTFARIFCTS